MPVAQLSSDLATWRMQGIGTDRDHDIISGDKTSFNCPIPFRAAGLLVS
jgi:hypothetical protein